MSSGFGLAPGPPISVVLVGPSVVIAVVVVSPGPVVVIVLVVVESSFGAVGADIVVVVTVVVVVSDGSFGAVGTDGVVTSPGRVTVVVGVVTSGARVEGGGCSSSLTKEE